MRRYLLIGTAAALLAIPALASAGSTTTVTVAPNNFNTFGPKNVTKSVGTGSIHWQWGTSGSTFAAHNVRQDDKLFYSGPVTNSKPSGFTVIPSAGSFHYYCELHGSATGGMAGSINVRPLITNKNANSFQVEWATSALQTGDAFDVRYRVDNGAWKVWRNDTTTRQGTFGFGNHPIHVGPGHTYDIQARSEKSTNLSKQSGWSPSARVTT
jgi:plastocyanin